MWCSIAANLLAIATTAATAAAVSCSMRIVQIVCMMELPHTVCAVCAYMNPSLTRAQSGVGK